MAAVQPVPLSSVPSLDFKHILVTTDFSECSRAALKQAAAIARLHGSDVLVLHVILPEPMIQNTLEPAAWEYQDIVVAAEKEMKAAETTEILTGIPHQLLVGHGVLDHVIPKLIADRDISLLVLGTHGRGGLKKLLLGSVAEEIFRFTDCPVMTIGPCESPALLTHGKFQSVLFATDFSAGSLHALPYAFSLAVESGAKLTLMHAVEEGSVTALYLHDQLITDTRKRLEQLVSPELQDRCAVEIEAIPGYPVEAILRLAEKKQADLIVIGVHKSGIVGAHTSAHLPWTIAQTVASHAKCPVLTVRG
ncbi:MAG: universal stress protein [Terriglobales bacterium]